MDLGIIPQAEASVLTLVKAIDKVLINPIIFFLFAVAMVYFLYGLVQYLLSPDNEEVRKKSKSVMMWGLIGLFIMVGVFGIMKLILSTFGENKIKINSNGDFAVTDTTLTDKEVKDSAKSNQNLLKPDSVDLSYQNTSSLPPETFTTDPFATYQLNDSMCWRKTMYVKSSTEFDALKLVKDIARKKFLSDNNISDKDTKYKNSPIAFSTKVLFDSTSKSHYAWIDARSPIKEGTAQSCNLNVLAPAKVLPDGVVTVDLRDATNTSLTTVNQAVITSYTTSPFTKKYVANPLCWQKEVYVKEDTEYKALQAIRPKARLEFLVDNSLEEKNVDQKWPKVYGVLSAYDTTTKSYYVWWDARAPIKTGTETDCNLAELETSTLPQKTEESKKIDPFTFKYQSTATYYRVHSSAVAPIYIDARSNAITNALIDIAKFKNLESISKVTYKILDELYYEKDATTGNYDYWVAVESKIN